MNAGAIAPDTLNETTPPQVWLADEVYVYDAEETNRALGGGGAEPPLPVEPKSCKIVHNNIRFPFSDPLPLRAEPTGGGR